MKLPPYNPFIVQSLNKATHYSFRNAYWLNLALIHSSYNLHKKEIPNNERLEFLGDRLLNLCISHYLFDYYPHKSPGELSKQLSQLVNQFTCAQIGRELGLNKSLILSESEERMNGREKDKIIANSVESLIAAIYQDLLEYNPQQAFNATQKVVIDLWKPYIHQTNTSYFSNPKSQLQEYAQKNQYAIPFYHLLTKDGLEHEPTFTLQVILKPLTAKLTTLSGEGTGKSKKEAEEKAALELLTYLKNHDKL